MDIRYLLDGKLYRHKHTTSSHMHLLGVRWRSSNRPVLCTAGPCVGCAGPVCETLCHSLAWQSSCSPAGPALPAAPDTSHTYLLSGPPLQWHHGSEPEHLTGPSVPGFPLWVEEETERSQQNNILRVPLHEYYSVLFSHVVNASHAF